MNNCEKCGKYSYLPYNDVVCYTCNTEFYSQFKYELVVNQKRFCSRCGRLGYLEDDECFCFYCNDIEIVNKKVVVSGQLRISSINHTPLLSTKKHNVLIPTKNFFSNLEEE